jgi:hypothetical protein
VASNDREKITERRPEQGGLGFMFGAAALGLFVLLAIVAVVAVLLLR